MRQEGRRLCSRRDRVGLARRRRAGRRGQQTCARFTVHAHDVVARVKPTAVVAADVTASCGELGALHGRLGDEVGRRVRVGRGVAFLDLDLRIAFKLGDLRVGQHFLILQRGGARQRRQRCVRPDAHQVRCAPGGTRRVVSRIGLGRIVFRSSLRGGAFLDAERLLRKGGGGRHGDGQGGSKSKNKCATHGRPPGSFAALVRHSNNGYAVRFRRAMAGTLQREWAAAQPERAGLASHARAPRRLI